MKKHPFLAKDILTKYNQEKGRLTELFFGSDDSTNASYKELILNSVNLAFENGKNEIFEYLQLSDSQIKEPIEVIELLDFLISWVPIEVSKNWTKFTTYFEVIIDNISSLILSLIPENCNACICIRKK